MSSPTGSLPSPTIHDREKESMVLKRTYDMPAMNGTCAATKRGDEGTA